MYCLFFAVLLLEVLSASHNQLLKWPYSIGVESVLSFVLRLS